MKLTTQLAKSIRDIHFGGNWTDSSFQEHLEDVLLKEATTQIQSFNTIAVLVFHVNYFVAGVNIFLEGEPLGIKDKYSFNIPPLNSEKDWQELLNKVWFDAEKLATLIEKLPEEKMEEFFLDEKYGTYYQNFQGIIEHCHYHLGQLVMIKKLIRL